MASKGQVRVVGDQESRTIREMYERQYGHLRDQRPIKGKGTQLLTVKEVAQILNMSIWFVYDALAKGKLRCQPVGRNRRIFLDDLNDYLIAERTRQL